MGTEEIEVSSIPFEVYEPLSWQEAKDEKLHLVDLEAKEDYGFAPNKKQFQVYNPPSNSDDGFLVYNLSEIDHAQSGDIGYAEIHLKDGSIYIHQERVGPDPWEKTVVDMDPIDYTSKGLYMTERILFNDYPGILKGLYRNTLDGRLMMIDSVFGGSEGHIPLTNKESPAVIRVCKDIEKPIRQIHKKDSIYNIHYEPNQQNVFSLMRAIADSHPRNMFVEIIRRVKWDGEQRIKTFLKSVGCRAMPGLGDKGDIYLEVVLEAFLLSVLERNLIEDYSSIQFVPVIVGGQGVGKSTLCEKLALRDFYRSCAVSVREQKRFYESCQGAVIVELKEGTQFQNDTDAEIKATIDSTHVQYRKPYAIEPTASTVFYSFILTTNDESPLPDQSGNRRYFPFWMNLIAVGDDNHPAIFDVTTEDILQLWAEALVLFKQGYRWHTKINTEEMKPIIHMMQNSITMDTPEGDDLYSYLDTYCPKIGSRFTTKDLTDYLYNIGRDDHEIRSIKQVFGKNCARFGFELVGTKQITTSLGVQVRTKVYARVRSPILDTIGGGEDGLS